MSNLVNTYENYLDVRDLAEIAEQCVETLSEWDGLSDDDEYTDARETLDAMKDALTDLDGYQFGTSEDSEVADKWKAVGDNIHVTIINDCYLREYVEEFLSDCGYLPADLPAIIVNNLDWDGIVEDWKADASGFYFDGEYFWVS